MASSRSARITRPSALLTILEVTTTMSPSARPVAVSATSPARSSPAVISGSPSTGITVTRLMLAAFLAAGRRPQPVLAAFPAAGRRPQPAARQRPISESSFSYFSGQVEGGAGNRGGRRRAAHVERERANGDTGQLGRVRGGLVLLVDQPAVEERRPVVRRDPHRGCRHAERGQALVGHAAHRR